MHKKISLSQPVDILKFIRPEGRLLVGKTLLALNLISESIEKLNEALAICVEFNSNQKLTNCYHLLAQAYLKNKDWKQSAKSYELYDDIQQRLNSIQLQKIYKLFYRNKA